VKIRVTRFKNLTFQRSDGIQVNKDIPSNLDQSLISKIDFDDYIVRILSASRGIAEKEFATFLDGSGKYIGCLVAGSAILSDENPNNDNPVFSAYSLIIAANVCASSAKGEYVDLH
jgi:hypothetical protein